MHEATMLNRLDEAFAALCELEGKEISVLFWKMYRQALLSELTIEQAIRSIEIAFTKKTFGFPRPADLIEFIKGNGDAEALTAWEYLQEAIRRGGAGASVIFLDSRITRVVEAMGGWQEVCNWLIAEMQFRRHEFMKLYKAAPDGGEPRVLEGWIERENRINGYLDHIPKPLIIGYGNRECIPSSSHVDNNGNTELLSEALGAIITHIPDGNKLHSDDARR